MVEKIQVQDLSAYYDGALALKKVNLTIYDHEILGIIGPANSGKTTFLRTLNRMNDFSPGFSYEGSVRIDGKDVYRDWEVPQLRKSVGMVFAIPTPLPITVFENLAYGPRRHGIRSRKRLSEIVERSLKAAFLWDEVKDRLHESAMKLSGGQQQRLCIARTLAAEPEVILFDEPCSGLDPISTAKIEEAMRELNKQYTLVLVTNNTKQAARVSDRVAFFLMGELVEIDETEKVFTIPKDERTEGYVSGRYG
ncbi:MAG: phosphate ABC transporter ATP-binding protein [Omnitrophica bacterium RIFCSPLOWO2_12_FULL_50_11]|nr:MAG: phosphate ABC transporter ATP-binding protein [Omnitrophica bacterium RIFCSPLOWO2_12_FULL_50_11]